MAQPRLAAPVRPKPMTAREHLARLAFAALLVAVPFFGSALILNLLGFTFA